MTINIRRVVLIPQREKLFNQAKYKIHRYVSNPTHRVAKVAPTK